MTRRCSHCSTNGHNSRTCPNRGVKIFGVRLTDGSIRKSASMGNLTHYVGGGSGSGTPQNGALCESPADTPDHPLAAAAATDGYGSEDFVAGSSSCRDRKKGTPWTEDEHRMFLLGLQKLGKGDWRGIARGYVISRTPTQVASHAQKYFIRQSNHSRRKRRSSLFDIVPDESVDTPLTSRGSPRSEPQTNPALLPPGDVQKDGESMEPEAAPCLIQECPNYPYSVVYPACIAPFFPVPMWPVYDSDAVREDGHVVVKPTAVHSKEAINVDELVGMSRLSLGGSLADSGPSELSLKLGGGSTRPSAFHANPSSDGSGIGPAHKPIHAI